MKTSTSLGFLMIGVLFLSFSASAAEPIKTKSRMPDSKSRMRRANTNQSSDKWETGTNYYHPPRRTESVNNLTVELLGHGGVYSLNYDRMVNERFALGLGFSYLQTEIDNPNYFAANNPKPKLSLTAIPVYGNYYFSDPEPHRFLLTGGITIAHISASVADRVVADESGSDFPSYIDKGSSASATVPVPMLGGGYEYRGDGGFLFRASIYGVIANGVHPWGGLAFGGHF